MSKRVIRDDIDKLHDYGIWVPSRIIYIGSESSDGDSNEGGVDFLMAEKAVKNLLILDSASSEPITIILNNPGGDFYHGMAIYDAIKKCQSHVTARVFGYAMSMGSIILQAADERIMSPGSRQMIHYGQESFDGHSKTARKWLIESDKINDWMEQVYLTRLREKNPKFTLKRLKSMLDHDTFLTAQESVELGLADKVSKEGEGFGS